MKLARIHGPDDLRVDEVPEPEIGPDDVLLEVRACGICGSDLGYVRLGGVQGPSDTPMPIGHELAGTVAAVGANCEAVAKVGDRVALHPGAAGFGLGNGGPEGGFAPRLLVRGAAHGRSLFALPDDLSFAHGALAEPLGVGMHAVDQADVQPGDLVAVLGAGPIGLSAIATLADRGVEDVVAIDRSAKRLEVARQLGAAHTIDTSKEELFEALGRIHGTSRLYWMELVGTTRLHRGHGRRPAARRGHPAMRAAEPDLRRRSAPQAGARRLHDGADEGAHDPRLDGVSRGYEEMIELLERRDLSPMITHRFPSTISSRPSTSPNPPTQARRS